MTAVGNLVHETATTTGTGNFTLSNKDGRQSFNAKFGTGGTDAFYYFISHQGAAEWEVGTGHLSASTTLVRDTVLNSSNADAAVNFSAGTKDVTNDSPETVQLVDLMTTRGDIIRRGATIPERLALGASGEALVSNGTDAYWGFADADADAIVASTSLPSANNVDITGISQAYHTLILRVNGCSFDTATRFLEVLVSTDNGSSFATSNYNGCLARGDGGATFMNTSMARTNANQGASATCDLQLVIHGFQDVSFASCYFVGDQSDQEPFFGASQYEGSSNNIDALRIQMNSTGNFDAGTYMLFGIR